MTQNPFVALRVLVVDDSVVVRRALADLLIQDPQIQLVDTAANGQIALKKLSIRCPDVVILDVDMPDMDGVETLKAIRLIHPKLPVLMFSALTEHAADVTINALFCGANDYITKPSGFTDPSQAAAYIRAQLIPKIKHITTKPSAKPSAPAPLPPPAPQTPHIASDTRPEIFPEVFAEFRPQSRFEAIVIATSTGGPVALVDLLTPLPANFPLPILIVQHMPPIFTQRLAERISRVTRLRAEEGRHGAPLHEAQVWIAPGGFHMTVERGQQTPCLALNQDPPENECRPAADILFRSAATTFQSRVLACVLTGMGRDATAGCRHIHAAGGTIFAQDRDSAVIWSMPENVITAGLASKVLSLSEMSEELCFVGLRLGLTGPLPEKAAKE